MESRYDSTDIYILRIIESAIRYIETIIFQVLFLYRFFYFHTMGKIYFSITQNMNTSKAIITAMKEEADIIIERF